MKYAEFTIDSNKIEYFNSVFGNETVLVSGQEVSNGFSVRGCTHRFKIGSDSFSLKSSYTLISKRVITLELNRNKTLVRELKINPNPNQRSYWLAVLIIILGAWLVNLFT